MFDYVDSLGTGGFNFDNHERNQLLMQNAKLQPPKVLKTGTTIVGLVFKDGVVLGADTRASAGHIAADKNCFKIHYLADNMYCCGAGTAADCDHVTAMMQRKLELHKLNTGRECRVAMAARQLVNHLFYYMGYIGAYLIIGGIDVKGPHLVSVTAEGNISNHNFYTLGSGSLAASAILESEYKDDLSLEEARAIVVKAIEGGIFHDMGSGSNVDVCVIQKGKADLKRSYHSYNKKVFGIEGGYNIKKGTTEVLKEVTIPLTDVIVEEGEMPMDLS